jgi:hypothetical protein
MARYVARVEIEVEFEAYGEADATMTANGLVDGIYAQLNGDEVMVTDFTITDLELTELYCSGCYDSLDPEKYDDTEDVLCQKCEEEQEEE